MYQVVIEKQVQKQMERIPEPDYSRVKAAINNLANDPRPHGCKKLKGRLGYRIRQGDYRIVYDINDRVLTVFIISADNRKDVYD